MSTESQSDQYCDQAQLEKTGDGVVVNLPAESPEQKQEIRQMVDNCAAGTCGCMTPEVKSKVRGMEVREDSQKRTIHITGDISLEEMRQTLIRGSREGNCC